MRAGRLYRRLPCDAIVRRYRKANLREAPWVYREKAAPR